MKLKEKILLKAVELFNERGISSTSPNQISAALGISVGNLTYHYKTKANLVKAVYDRMYADSQDYMELKGYMTLYDFRKIMEKFRAFKESYRFFFHDLSYIIRNYPEAAKMVEDANLKRFEQGRALFNYFVETGRMIPEAAGINYDFLTHNVWTVAVFWDVQSNIMPPITIFQKPMDMVDMIWYMILPYLTEKGKEEYEQINEFLLKG